jgi:predicted AAA+ superfamily ATPase
LAYALRRGPLLDDVAVAESAVGAELIRRYETFPQYGYSSLDAVFTWKGAGGHEIDFVAATDRMHGHKQVLPVEVKYQNSISEWDWKPLEKSFGKGMLVTKEKVSVRQDGGVRVVGLRDFLVNAAV